MAKKKILTLAATSALLVLSACGGGGGSAGNQSAGSQFMAVQGANNIEAIEGDQVGVTATGVSFKSASVGFAQWFPGPQSTIEVVTSSTGDISGKVVLENANCAQFSTSGTDNTDSTFRSEGRRTCTVFAKLPAISNPSEKVHLVFNAEDDAGNQVSSDFFLTIVRSSGRLPGGNAVSITGATVKNGSQSGTSLQMIPGETAVLRVQAQGSIAEIQSVNFSENTGSGGNVTNAACTVNTRSQGVFTCEAGFTAPQVTTLTRYGFTATATDTRGNQNNIAFNVAVSPNGFSAISSQPSILSSPSNPVVIKPNGNEASFDCFASGGQPPYTFRWNMARPSTNPLAPAITVTSEVNSDGNIGTARFNTPSTTVAGVYKLTCDLTDGANNKPPVPSEIYIRFAESDFRVRTNPAPVSTEIQAGTSQRLAAVLQDGSGNDISSSGYGFSWEPVNTPSGVDSVSTADGLEYNFVAPRNSTSQTQTVTLRLCAAPSDAIATAKIANSANNACDASPNATYDYTARVRPTTDNGPATVAQANFGTSTAIVNTTTYNAGDTVAVTGTNSQAIGGADSSQIRYQWKVTPTLAVTGDRSINATINTTSAAAGSYAVSLCTTLISTSDCFALAAAQKSESTINFTIAGAPTPSITANAGADAEFRFNRPDVVVNASATVGANLQGNAISYQWRRINENSNVIKVAGANQCPQANFDGVTAYAGGIAGGEVVSGGSSSSASRNLTSVPTQSTAPRFRYLVRASATVSGTEYSDCDAVDYRFVGAKISITASVDLPIISFANDQEVNLTSTTSNPDNANVRYSWVLVGGPTADVGIGAPGSANTIVQFAGGAVGAQYTFELLAYDTTELTQFGGSVNESQLIVDGSATRNDYKTNYPSRFARVTVTVNP